MNLLRQFTFTFTLLFVVTAASAVTITFDNDVEGFSNANGISTVWSADDGGVLCIEAFGGGSFFESASRAGGISFAPGTALGDEMALAFANGGTISYDIRIEGDDINWAGPGRPGVLEVQTTVEGDDRDTEVALLGVPAAGQTQTGTFTADIVAGSGNQFNGTNGTINYDDGLNGNGTGTIFIGFKDDGDFITDATFYVDNFSVVAVPEPASVALVGIAFFGVVAIRRRK